MDIIEEVDVKRIFRADGTVDAVVTTKDGRSFVLANVKSVAENVDLETAERVAAAPRTEARN